MLFNSLEYLLLLSGTLVLYWATSAQTVRLTLLLISSFVFYASWEPYLLLFLIAVIVANFVLALSPVMRRRLGFALIICLNLLTLAYYKYTNFILGSLSDLANLFNWSMPDQRFSIILPIGISFFTFQLIAYIIDIRRGTVEPERSLLRFGVFISFFPQLIAGPICRSSQFLPQLQRPVEFHYSRLAQGALMLATGLFLKVAIADNLAEYVDQIFDATTEPNQAQALIATIAFGVQILCDFWGYSTMALGSAHLFGFSIPSNFDLPYLATSLQSFWRRWHITLSFWLRDYLYVSLGGNRAGQVRTYLNLMIVMVLGGLWHGASYNFMIWGLIHGLGLALERFLSRLPALTLLPNGRFASLLGRAAGWCITMFLVFLAWIFFRAADLASASTIVSAVLSFNGAFQLGQPEQDLMRFLILFAVVMVPLHMLNEAGNNANFYREPDFGREGPGGELQMLPSVGRPAIQAMAIVLPSTLKLIIAFWLANAAVILGSSAAVPFIYFQF